MKLGNIIRKTICVIGIISVALVLLLNIVYESRVSSDLNEKITIIHYGIPNLAIAVVIAIAIYEISRILKDKKIDLVWIIVAYLLVQILWIHFVNVYPVTDQLRVYTAAVEMAMRKRKNISRGLFGKISSAADYCIFV